VLEEAGVVVSPGPAYGPSGEGFFRLSLTVPDEQLEEAVRRIEALGVASVEPPGSPEPPPPARFARGPYGAA
jgi:hypothetical protein